MKDNFTVQRRTCPGGLVKVKALRGVLRSGILHGLIIDEATAQALVADKPETTSGRAKSKGRKGK